MRVKDISIILMSFGLVIILNSFLDFYNLLFPLLIKNSEWVYIVSQKITGLILLPILGILAFLIGLGFSNFRRNKIIVNTTRIVTGGLCLLFFFFLLFNMVMYKISMNSVKVNNIDALKIENSQLIQRINLKYKNGEEECKSALKSLNNDLIYKINYLNLTYTKTNIKTLMSLFLFSIVYLVTAVFILKK